MGETPEQKFDRVSQTVQEAILKGYPNPERLGCPSDDIVRKVAERTELNPDQLWEHITHCSPCYGLFLTFKIDARRRRAFQRRGLLVGAALAASLVPIMFFAHSHRTDHARVDQLVGDWDLERTSGTRGVAKPTNEAIPTEQHASRSQGHILIHLPLGTDQGSYNLEIRKTEEGQSLRSATGQAAIVEGHTILSVNIDLSDMQAGSYFAAIGRGNYTWRVYPLLLQ